MNAPSLIFGADGVAFDFASRVTGFAATVQAGLVVLGCRPASDVIFPDKGSEIADPVWRSNVVSTDMTRHMCNFAATSLLFFARTSTAASDPDNIADCQLVPLNLTNNATLMVNARFVSNSGVTVGTEASL